MQNMSLWCVVLASEFVLGTLPDMKQKDVVLIANLLLVMIAWMGLNTGKSK